MKPCILYLTCADEKEAELITVKLLDNKLVVCVKKSSITSRYYWKGKIESAREILLIMDSSEKLFDRVESEVKKLHSYETFNLVLVPAAKTSNGISEWMKEGLAK